MQPTLKYIMLQDLRKETGRLFPIPPYRVASLQGPLGKGETREGADFRGPSGTEHQCVRPWRRVTI